MSQDNKPKSKLNTSDEGAQCYIHSNVPPHWVESIHENICSNSPTPLLHLDGHYYCLFHSPDEEKNGSVFYERLEILFELGDKKLADAKRLPCKEQEEELEYVFYDFRFVWFPSDLVIRSRDFEIGLDFSFATINKNTDLSWSYMTGYLRFVGARFNGVFQFNQGKVGESDFSGAVFNGLVSFYANQFNGSAIFDGARFIKPVEFCESQFADFTSFDEATFEDSANFFHADFNGSEHFAATFRSATFKKYTTFSHVSFHSLAEFTRTSFEDALEFDGNFGGFESATFQFSTFEKPEKVLFYRSFLHPSWFIHIDPSQFVFTDNVWANLENGDVGVRSELELLTERSVYTLDISNPYRLLSIACRQLADNAERNSRFENASGFRRMAMETEWLEKKNRVATWVGNLTAENYKLQRRFAGSEEAGDQPIEPVNSFGIMRRCGDFLLYFFYRFTSYYGESWQRALIVLIGTLLFFSFIYTQMEFVVCVETLRSPEMNQSKICQIRTLDFFEGIQQSFSVSLFQSSEYRKPSNSNTEIITIFEKIFVPLQAALFALAVRRKFMR